MSDLTPSGQQPGQPPDGALPPHDRYDQLEKVLAGLMPGEVVQVVFDCIGIGTGFVGVTDKRVVLQDNSFVGKKQAITSIPYSKVQSVSYLSDKSVFGRLASSSTIMLRVSGTVYEATFRGDDKAKFVHDYVLYKIL